MRSIKAAVITAIAFLAIWAAPAAFGAEPEIKSQWQGKRVAFLGDSIIDKRQLATQTTFPEELRRILGIESFVYGISGNQMNQILPQAKRMEAELGQDVDAIIVFIGTNDFNHGIPLGEWFTEGRDSAQIRQDLTVMRKHRTMVKTNDTFRGRANIALDYLKANYPTKQIIFMTPIHRALFIGGPGNIQQNEDYANALGLYIDSYIEAVKELGNVWSVPVIDLNAISGLYPIYDSQAQYFRSPNADRLHPNSKGHRRLAYTIAYQLLGYPAGFED